MIAGFYCWTCHRADPIEGNKGCVYCKLKKKNVLKIDECWWYIMRGTDEPHISAPPPCEFTETYTVDMRTVPNFDIVDRSSFKK